MFAQSHAFSSFSVDNLEKAKEFYGEILGMKVKELPGMGIELHVAGGNPVFIYPKDDHHVPASFTVLNFPVKDVEKAVEDLIEKGVTFEQYPEMETDERGISHQGTHSMAWFKDPAGNILSILTEMEASSTVIERVV